MADIQLLQEQFDNIEEFKEETFLNTSSVGTEHVLGDDSDKTDVSNEPPLDEETYLQQSKRSVYYKKCLEIYNQFAKNPDDNDDDVAAEGDNDVDMDDLNDYNALYSPQYAHYFLNNWCGLISLWTCLHLKDQGRHGTSSVYEEWSAKFASFDCVVNPPRTQGIVEFHQKSAKHITMNSRRERLDDVVKNLQLAKISISRTYDIKKARSKSKTDTFAKDKVKDSLPNKIVSENWKKPKQSKGPGFFKQNRKIKLKGKQEVWQKIPIIPWGGDHQLEDGRVKEMSNTCTIDGLLQILLVFYSLNINEMQRLFQDNLDHLQQKLNVF